MSQNLLSRNWSQVTRCQWFRMILSRVCNFLLLWPLRAGQRLKSQSKDGSYFRIFLNSIFKFFWHLSSRFSLFFLRFPEFVGHFSHTCFSNICSNSPSFFNPKFYFVKRIVDIIKTRWAQFTQAFGTFCAERFLISCFVLITWHEDRACRAENCFVFPKLFMANFRSLMKIRRNIALCFGEITHGASENLPTSFRTRVRWNFMRTIDEIQWLSFPLLLHNTVLVLVS